MYLGVSTLGYGFLPTEYFVNVCQRLSTRLFAWICLFFNTLGFVHTVNRKMCAFNISKICSDIKKTILFRTVLNMYYLGRKVRFLLQHPCGMNDVRLETHIQVGCLRTVYYL